MIKGAQDVYHDSLTGIRDRLVINFEQEILRFFNIISRQLNRIFYKKSKKSIVFREYRKSCVNRKKPSNIIK